MPNLFTLTEDQEQCYDFKLRSVGPSFAIAIDRLLAQSSIAVKVLDPLLDKIVKLKKVSADGLILYTTYLFTHYLSMILLIHMNPIQVRIWLMFTLTWDKTFIRPRLYNQYNITT